MGIFEPALSRIVGKSVDVYPPTSFQDYLKEHGLPSKNTASTISIDSYEQLPSELKANDVMVLRLGSAVGTGTQFSLVRIEGRLRDFFLFDQEIFQDRSGSLYLPGTSMGHLFAYQLLPDLTETSLVNLGLASGLISSALGIDPEDSTLIPATGRTTFTFQVKLHSNIPQPFTHNNGQVEIDALFVEKRNGKETLFIIEAKSNDANKSLAKHKLVYPIMAVAPNVPGDMPIVPVYLKVLKSKQGIHYHVVECSFPDPRGEVRAIDELQVVKHTHFILPFFRIGKKKQSF
jgi:hypothetical protein